MPEPRPSRSSFQTYLFIALVAVELLMSFTFLGYLHVQPISITFAYIPPILAGCLLGPVQATVLGAVFGLALLWCRKRRHPRLWMILPAALAPKLHAGLVYLAMGTFSPRRATAGPG